MPSTIVEGTNIDIDRDLLDEEEERGDRDLQKEDIEDTEDTEDTEVIHRLHNIFIYFFFLINIKTSWKPVNTVY
jgi:hypothetical protein